MQVVILGGGYAGLTVAIEVKKAHPRSSIILIDKKTYFTKLTQLHKTVTESPKKYRLDYAQLGQRLGFRFIQDDIVFDATTLARFSRDRGLLTAAGALSFDALVVTSGATPVTPVPADGIAIWNLSQIAAFGLADKLNSLLPGSSVTICGAGATGLQFLGEIAARYLRKFRLSLINFAEILLDQWPIEFHRYVMDKLNYWNIEYYPVTALEQVEQDQLVMRNRANGEIIEKKSDLTLLFTGVAPQPFRISADSFGRVLHDGEPLDALYTAGDCSHFQTGLNAMTAQAAMRKAKVVAHNIAFHLRQAPRKYLFEELGYFVSLGPGDAIGYLLQQNLRVTGMAAWLLKEGIESQFDLYLNGIDTFLI